jgi:hypothetical protein
MQYLRAECFLLPKLLDDCGRAIYQLFRTCKRARGECIGTSTNLVLKRQPEQGTVAFDQWIIDSENVLSSCPRSHQAALTFSFVLPMRSFIAMTVMALCHTRSRTSTTSSRTSLRRFSFHSTSSTAPALSILLGHSIFLHVHLFVVFNTHRNPQILNAGLSAFATFYTFRLGISKFSSRPFQPNLQPHWTTRHN